MASLSWVNTLHAAEVPIVVAVQAATPHWLEEALALYTEWIHPNTAFTFVAPLLFALAKRAVAMHLLVVCACTDITNLVLKWLIAGDRPYWASEDVRQFRMTCEGGYGMPSGHVMAFTAVTYFLLARLRAPRYLYVFHAALVCIGAYSRVYTGAHFPSQTMAGWAVGATYGLSGHRILASGGASPYVGAKAAGMTRSLIFAGLAALLLSGVLALFYGLHHGGRDPMASVLEARRACRSELGVIGLVSETAARVLGVLLGVAASSLWTPCTDEVFPLNFGVLDALRGATALGAISIHSRCLGALAIVAKDLSDGPDGPLSILLAASQGLACVVLAAVLGQLTQLAVAVAEAASKKQ